MTLNLAEAGVTLQPAQFYDYAVSATDANGTNQARGGSFTTLPGPSSPLVSTGPATNITPTSATVGGSIALAAWSSTAYTFQYGLTTAYGSSVPTPPAMIPPFAVCGLPCDGQRTTWNASETLTGLTPGVTYHYRLTASSEGETFYGRDATFTTAPAPEAATTASDAGAVEKYLAHGRLVGVNPRKRDIRPGKRHWRDRRKSHRRHHRKHYRSH